LSRKRFHCRPSSNAGINRVKKYSTNHAINIYCHKSHSIFNKLYYETLQYNIYTDKIMLDELLFCDGYIHNLGFCTNNNDDDDNNNSYYIIIMVIISSN